MLTKRTDLAVEAHELWNESPEEKTILRGVKARDYTNQGCTVTKVSILDEEGSEALGKPCGTYVTVELTGLARHENDSFERCVRAIADEISKMVQIEPDQSVLVVGLGNWNITPDAIGPKTVDNTMVTRHLVERMPDVFGALRGVSALTPGVLGTTGLESAEIIRGVVDRSNPACIIVIDALVSRKLSRLCSTVQIADTGIVPGSGVGNARAAINREVLGVPVIAIGVPTVVDAATLAADLTESAGICDVPAEQLAPFGGSLIVTPKEIDSQVSDIAKVVGYAINMSLHDGLDIDEITGYLS